MKVFLECVSKLEPLEFAGLATMLKIPLEEDGVPRAFEDIFKDVIEKFPTLRWKLRRDIKKMLIELTGKK